MDDERRRHAVSFDGVASVYERARPAYPAGAVPWLIGEHPRDVLDLGAGTGKLTRQLVAAGHRVTAVEPLDGMRAELERAVPGVTTLSGTAEAIPLPDASVDVVVAAQAFHWFDRPIALPEIARVLRPGGHLALVWNVRDETEAWARRLGRAMGPEVVVEEEPVAAQVGASGAFAAVEETTLPHAQRLDLERLLDLVRSRSYWAVAAPDEQVRVLERVEELFVEVAVDGSVDLPYVTECYRAARLPDGWAVVDGALERELRFADFAEAIAFVNRVAEVAEAADHHPDIAIRWNRVTLRFWTHSSGAITTRDVELALLVDDLEGSQPGP